MYDYNYRVYGNINHAGYKLLEITNSLKKALTYTNKMEYDEILIIRRNLDLKMDLLIMLMMKQINLKLNIK